MKENVFTILCLCVICISALLLSFILLRMAKRPSSTRRNPAMAGVIVGFASATPAVLWVILVIKYIFFDGRH